MLSMGLKNAILALLIILILHVLIKNSIIDKKLHDKKKETTISRNNVEVPSGSSLNNKNNMMGASIEEFKAPINSEDIIKIDKKECENALKIDEEALKQSEKESELFKFVYGDEADTEDISKFFKGNDVTRDVKEEIDDVKKCPIRKTDDNSLPLSTTCDPQLQKISENRDNKTVIKNCGLDQNLSNMMYLNVYENEDAMNGGPIYGGLSAYDNVISNYEDYQCSKNI